MKDNKKRALAYLLSVLMLVTTVFGPNVALAQNVIKVGDNNPTISVIEPTTNETSTNDTVRIEQPKGEEITPIISNQPAATESQPSTQTESNQLRTITPFNISSTMMPLFAEETNTSYEAYSSDGISYIRPEGSTTTQVAYNYDNTKVLPTSPETSVKFIEAETGVSKDVKRVIYNGYPNREEDIKLSYNKAGLGTPTDAEIYKATQAAIDYFMSNEPKTLTAPANRKDETKEAKVYNIYEFLIGEKVEGNPLDLKLSVVPTDQSVQKFDPTTSATEAGYNTLVSANFIKDPLAPSAIFKLSKNLVGGILKEGQFSFELLDSTGKTLQTTKNQANGNIVFDPVSFYQMGDYEYKVKEIRGIDPEITYDSKEIKITVSVTDPKNDGNLVVSPAQYDSGDRQFDNVFSGKLSTAKILAKKTLEGRTIKDHEFSFKISSLTEDAPMPSNGDTVTNIGEDINFGEIKFSQPGTYRYELTEIPGTDRTISYDRSVKEITVIVDETLQAFVAYKDNDNTFKNKANGNNGLVDMYFSYQDFDTNQRLQGVTLRITGSHLDKPYTWTTGVNNNPIGLKMPPGDYILSEDAPLSGYQKTPAIPFTVTQDGKILVNGQTIAGNILHMRARKLAGQPVQPTQPGQPTPQPGGTNTNNQAGQPAPGSNLTNSSIQLIKQDASTKLALPGAEFSLYLKGKDQANPSDGAGTVSNTAKINFSDTNAGELKGSYTTDQKGTITLDKLPVGDYYFIETKAPAGYQGDFTKKIEFSVTENMTAPIVLRVDNTKIGALANNTGSAGNSLTNPKGRLTDPKGGTALNNTATRANTAGPNPRTLIQGYAPHIAAIVLAGSGLAFADIKRRKNAKLALEDQEAKDEDIQ